MEIQITARHMELTPALVEFVHKKIQKINKYIDTVNSVHIVLECEKYRQSAQVIFHAAGTTFRAKDTAPDMYAALDSVADMIDMQLKKFKDRRTFHHGKDKLSIAAAAINNENPSIQKGELVNVKTLALNEAIDDLDKTSASFLIFRNSATGEIEQLEKRNDEYIVSVVMM